MVPFKDFLKKAKDVAEKGLSTVKEAMAYEALLRDFDEKVANTIAAILQESGYRVIGQREEGDYYKLVVAVDDLEKVKPIVDRALVRKYSPKDREKILEVIPDTLEFRVFFARKMQAPSTLFPSSQPDDVHVKALLRFFVERKGGFLSKVKRDEIVWDLGSFSFRSSDFVKEGEVAIDEERLKQYLTEKLKAFGII